MHERAVPRGLALLVAGTLFMEILDGTVLSTAAPAIAATFGISSVDVNVAMTSYLLTIAVCIPVSGYLADRFGTRPIFCAAIVVFTVASVLCALSVNLPMLTAFRMLQAVGGAMMVPVGRLIVLDRTPKDRFLTAVAYFTWPALVAPVIAPAVGGVITEYLSWHWIFLLNVPIGVIAFLVALKIVPRIDPKSVPRLDWTGFGLIAVTIAALVVGAESVGRPSPPWVLVVVCAAITVSTGVVGLRHLRRSRTPLFDLSILRIPTFRVSNAGGTVYRVVINSAPFLLPLLFQDAFGWDPVLSGVMVGALFVGNVAIKPVVNPLIRRFGFRTVLIVNGVAAALSFAAYALLSESTPIAVVAVVLAVSGAFRSIGFTAYNTLAYADIEPAGMSNANSISATVQQLGLGLGVAFGALALNLGTTAVSAAGGDDGGPLPFRLAFCALAAVMLLAVVESVRLHPDAGSEVTGRRR